MVSPISSLPFLLAGAALVLPGAIVPSNPCTSLLSFSSFVLRRRLHCTGRPMPPISTSATQVNSAVDRDSTNVDARGGEALRPCRALRKRRNSAQQGHNSSHVQQREREVIANDWLARKKEAITRPFSLQPIRKRPARELAWLGDLGLQITSACPTPTPTPICIPDQQPSWRSAHGFFAFLPRSAVSLVFSSRFIAAVPSGYTTIIMICWSGVAIPELPWLQGKNHSTSRGA